ncbi:MAG: carbohydrate porin [Rhodomicrobium sp.]
MRIDIFDPARGRHRTVLGCAAGGLMPPVSGSRASLKFWLALSAAAIVALSAGSALAADIMPAGQAAVPDAEPSAVDWTGFYLGGHLGYAWGNSKWTASTAAGVPIATGSLGLTQPIDSFKESGSFLEGFQTGYNYMLPNRFVIGGEADVSFPSYPSPVNGLSMGGSSTLLHGTESYSDNVFASGTARARIGYAPGNWLFYATGGLAWSYDQVTLDNLAGKTSEGPLLWRLGWTAGAGAEVPVAPHWSAKAEYLFTDYSFSSVAFPLAAQRFNSDLSLQEVRVGVNYRFAGDAGASEKDAAKPAAPDSDNVSFHGQATVTWQGYPAFRSPYQGANSLPGGGQGDETVDVTLYAGLRLWRGAEFWVDPEIDQGFGVGNTHGVAGYPSAEAYKLGLDEPYARVQRYFIRQTIDLGGATEKVEADQNQFAGSQTADRLVLTVGKFAIVDIFDTNKYANNPKSDFLNWSVINAGTFDYAGDAWGFTYGGAAEWYRGRWTLRGGVFDLSETPAGGISPLSSSLDPTFRNFELVGEIEERHELWGQPGKLKVTGYLEFGSMGSYADAIAVAAEYGYADINAVRKYQSRPGVSANLEQQVSEDIGVFARAGWGDGNVEPFDFTDIDYTVSAGVSVSGKQWGRADDRVGVAGVLNDISGIHAAFFNDGGLGILIGDGILPNAGWEKILEAYYSYSLTSSTKLTFDYQFIGDPAYNTDRGPVNVVAGRFHWQF